MKIKIICLTRSVLCTSLFLVLLMGVGCLNKDDAKDDSNDDTAVTLTSLSISPTDQTISINSTEQYSVIAYYSDDSSSDVTLQATWTSSDTNFVTIDATGLASAGANETDAPITISAELNSISVSTTLSVVDLSPAVTQVSPIGGPIAGGTSTTITGLNFSEASRVQFGATDATSFTVDSDNVITAISPAGTSGPVDISVTTPQGTSTTNSSDQFTYIGEAPTITNIDLHFGPTAGGTTVTITGANFTTASSVQFGGVDATSFTVNSVTSITAVTPAGTAGPVDISVTNVIGTGTESNAFYYTDVSLVSITVTPDSLHLPRSFSRQYTATGTFSDFSTLDLTDVVTWNSSDQSVATTTETGLVSAVALGTINISAQIDAITGQTTLAVNDAVLIFIAITPPNPAVARGSTVQLTATGTFSDGGTLDITNECIWGSSNTSIATISDAGLATGVAGGAINITADLNSIHGVTSLHVNP